MAKAAINKTLKLNANGIIGMDNGVLAVENPDTGELIPFHILLSDFLDKPVWKSPKRVSPISLKV